MIVLCDVDGVLAQWKVVFKRHLSDVGFDVAGIGWVSPDLPLTKAQREYAWMKMSEPRAAYDLEPFPGAIEGLARIIKEHDVYFVTAQVERSRTWVFDRTAWLVKYFGEDQGNKIVSTHYKHLIDGDVLIDDKDYNVTPWKRRYPRGLAVLWDHPHNQESKTLGKRMSDWDELYKEILLSEDPYPVVM